MANNRKITRGRKRNEEFKMFEGSPVRVRKQYIYSKPRRIFKERYITDHMLEKAIRMGMSKKEALRIYGKNRYVPNPEFDSKPIKVITHILT